MAKVTDGQIIKYCKYQKYKLLHIGKIAFAYQREDGSAHSLLKAGACSIELHECPICAFVWKHGRDGSHSCSENLEQDAKRWRALMSSKRIRFMGPARLGKDKGQVLCIEFHSNIGDGFTFKKIEEAEASRERLRKYTDTLIKKNNQDNT